MLRKTISLVSERFSTVSLSEGPIQRTIRRKLIERFSPSHLEIECESRLHKGPRDAERHFRVEIVSDHFEGLRTVQMHRLVNQCLADELAGPVHALRITAYPTSKYEGQQASPSPACRGGHGAQT
ncbi:Putative bolA-like protein K11H12.1 [Toxocara canis]|uniref:Putative bolA-like protein K11H12.1 n=1 Tax=Toxocara canis TaxID=6265 RepID=A0A0B2UY19_TOXCA|nr:Putative bolA-like protein K11H12.1 [Toxocara canis]